MYRIFIYILLVVVSLPVSASLQEGWRKAGWLDNYGAALVKARKLNRPVLVYFDASWCSWCQQYKREVLDKPAIKYALKHFWIPVVIDYDAQPDLFNRFGGTGLPYTVMLSSQGRLLNRFSGILSENDFLTTLKKTAARTERLADSRPEISESITVKSINHAGYHTFNKAFLSHIDSLYSDEESTLTGHYETGASLKRPSPRTWMYLKQRNLWKKRIPKAIRRESAQLMDKIDGGFFNFFDTNRIDEDYLESSKLLEVNAWLTAWFAQYAKEDKAAAISVESGWYFLRTVLWDKQQGGFWQSQLANNKYYEAPLTIRPKLMPPPVDKLKRADTNAQAAIALHQAGSALSNKEMKLYAEKTLEFILGRMIAESSLYHIYKPSGLSVNALPQDLFWILLAGKEVSGMQRHSGMNIVKKQAQVWLADQMLTKAASRLPIELIGLVAQTVCSKQYATVFPRTSCGWAIKQLRIDAETSPDSLIPGLLAWEAYLTRRK